MLFNKQNTFNKITKIGLKRQVLCIFVEFVGNTHRTYLTYPIATAIFQNTITLG